MVNKKATVEELYKYHTANLRALKAAKSQIAPLAKAAIATKRTAELSSLLKLYSFLIGACAEVRLLKVLHEPSAFSDAERASILSKKTQLDQWKMLAETAFRKHYAIALPAPIKTLPFTPRSRFEAIFKLFDSELSTIITVRNKLAHGQWEYALNGDNDAIEQGIMKELRKENFLSLLFKDDLIDCIANIANILSVSQQTFERDFDLLFATLEQLQSNLRNRKYIKYEAMLVARHQRARRERSGGQQAPG
ncbi:hypothetical protein [Pandoraea pnomenusa]|uniref:hypothetical protein n=1 Tax=Pandoraea pnomenusa TaxID=93220 RepID=UPI001AC7947E|nr:hypothetical protein [Pandoraea pnomenusa]MBN9096462.1 hypothetical protein [Pandoraea pnomenusa]